MKTNTFIYIVAAYSLLLGITAVFTPDLSLEYFGSHPGEPMEQSLINYLGMYQIALAILAFYTAKSTDISMRRAFLLVTGLLLISAIIGQAYNTLVRHMPQHPTFWLDNGFWLIMGIASFYFMRKEK
jgi:hypothetical protein